MLILIRLLVINLRTVNLNWIPSSRAVSPSILVGCRSSECHNGSNSWLRIGDLEGLGREREGVRVLVGFLDGGEGWAESLDGRHGARWCECLRVF